MIVGDYIITKGIGQHQPTFSLLKYAFGIFIYQRKDITGRDKFAGIDARRSVA
jgi:hypothetical protein